MGGGWRGGRDIVDYALLGVTQKIAGNTFEPEYDTFLQFELEIGHVVPGYPGKTYPILSGMVILCRPCK